MRRLTALALVLFVCGVLLPGSAAGHSLVRPAGSVVSYLAVDATSLNSLQARQSGNRIEFRDESVDGGMDPGSCTPGDVDGAGFIIQTFCPLGGVQRVRIDLGEREDTARVALPVPATVLGGPGADRVTAGGSADELSGGEGNDRLDGGAGDDVVAGDQGSDTVGGGAGSDRLVVRDGVLDEVSCGEGTDTVDADTLDRLSADCERVTRTATPAPEGAGADDGRAPQVEVGAPTLQRLGRGRSVRVYATTSERGTLSASGALHVGGLALPVKTVDRKRIRVGGGGAELVYRIKGRHWREASQALRRGRRVTVRLGVVGTDLAGQSKRRNAPAITVVGGGRSGRAAAALRAATALHPEPGDIDGDEVRDEVDNCPTVKNGSQLDTNRDGQGDACDDDDDGDGVLDAQPDNCRVVANPDQADSNGDGRGDACPPVDSDGDGILDEDDNCDSFPSPNQSDIDGDDNGDVCDDDMDGDVYPNARDNCPTVYNIEYFDGDGDGTAESFRQPDADGDGIGTACDPNESVVGGGGTGTGGGGNDKRRPRLRVRVERRQRLAAVKAGLVVGLRCSEACGTTVELQISRKSARRLGLRRTRVLADGTATLQGAGSTYAFVRFDRRVRRKLFRMRKVTAKLTAVAVDGGGNRRSLAQRVALVR